MNEPGGRWDGWDDPVYRPTQAELNEPVDIGCDDPEVLAPVLMSAQPPEPR